MRWIMFAAAIIGTDWVAVKRMARARSYLSECVVSGPMTAMRSYHTKYDGSAVWIVHNRLTGVTTTTVVCPATWSGLCAVWWPIVATGLITLLALVVPLTSRGRRVIAAIPLPPMPRMTTRRWLIVVAVVGTEAGLIFDTLRSSGVDPLYARWPPILVGLALLHALAFLPAGVALLYRYVRGQRFQNDPESVSDCP
jgi:hypothetical protein